MPEHLIPLPLALYTEQGDKLYLELVLMLYYEMLKVQIIASWGICCGRPLDGLFMLCWKRVRTRKRAWTKGREESVGYLARGCAGDKPVRAASCSQKGIVLM